MMHHFQLSDINPLYIYPGEIGKFFQFNIDEIGNSSTLPCPIYAVSERTDSNVNWDLITQGNVL